MERTASSQSYTATHKKPRRRHRARGTTQGNNLCACVPCTSLVASQWSALDVRKETGLRTLRQLRARAVVRTSRDRKPRCRLLLIASSIHAYQIQLTVSRECDACDRTPEVIHSQLKDGMMTRSKINTAHHSAPNVIPPNGAVNAGCQ